MSPDPQARKRCPKQMERKGKQKRAAKQKEGKHNMASGPAWHCKLWINVNGWV